MICVACEEDKPEDDFYDASSGGKQKRCKDCYRANARRDYKYGGKRCKGEPMSEEATLAYRFNFNRDSADRRREYWGACQVGK